MVHKYINSPHRLQTKIVIFLQERPLPIALYPVQKEHQAVTNHGIKQVTSVYECANQARILINEKLYRYLTHPLFPISELWRDNYSPLHDQQHLGITGVESVQIVEVKD